MNTVLMAVLAILMIFALAQGSVWMAVGIAVVAAVVSLVGERGRGYNPSPFMYKSPDLGPISPGIEENMLRIKYQTDWTGHDDDYEYHNVIGERMGAGIGRGLGFLR